MTPERRELDELRKDKERLDWLEGLGVVEAFTRNRHGQTWNKFEWIHTSPEPIETLREAIDAARNPKPV